MGRYQRDQAWAIEPYPCIGGFAFLLLSLMRHPQYAAVLERLKYPQTPNNASDDYRQESLLDLGCCMRQDLRKLAFDGVPVTSLHGADLRPDLMAVGFDLFRGRNRWSQLPDAFFELDVLDPVLPTSLQPKYPPWQSTFGPGHLFHGCFHRCPYCYDFAPLRQASTSHSLHKYRDEVSIVCSQEV